MRRTLAASSLIVLVVALCAPVPASEMYKWTDDEGNLHVATSLEDVPERYRDQVTTMKSETSPARKPLSTTEPVPDEPAEPSEPTAEASELRRFEVPYRNEGSARRVIIPVTFNDRVTAPMALDTGSPGMVITIDLAVRLGIFSRDSGTLLTEAAGIGGQAPAILTIVDSVSVEGVRDTFVPTTVTFALSDEFSGLIGMDFLANYTLSIDSKKQVVVFQENPPDPDARGGHDESWWRQTFGDFRLMRDAWLEHSRTANLRPDSNAARLVEFQVRESERLLQRLENHASDNSVPQHWRIAR